MKQAEDTVWFHWEIDYLTSFHSLPQHMGFFLAFSLIPSALGRARDAQRDDHGHVHFADHYYGLGAFWTA